MKYHTITDGLLFPEGPIAMPDGTVLVVEIARGTLTRVFPDGRKEIVAETGGGPNGAAIGPDGKCYVCNNGGFKWKVEPNGNRRSIAQSDDYVSGRIERVDLDTGTVEVLYDACDGRPLKGPNDIVFDRSGGFWFTDLGKVREREIDRGGIYYARTDGSLVREVVHPFLTANGIGLAPDEKTLYVAETEGGRLWSYPNRRRRRGREGAVPALAQRRPARHLRRRISALRLPRAGGLRQHLRGDPDDRRDHGGEPGRRHGGVRRVRRPLHHQHLLRRTRPPHRVRDPVVGRTPRRYGLAAARTAAELPQHLNTSRAVPPARTEPPGNLGRPARFNNRGPAAHLRARRPRSRDPPAPVRRRMAILPRSFATEAAGMAERDFDLQTFQGLILALED